MKMKSFLGSRVQICIYIYLSFKIVISFCISIFDLYTDCKLEQQLLTK